MWVPLCTHIYVQSLNEDRKWRNVVCRLTEVLLFLYICLRKEGRHLSPLSSRDLGVKNHLVSGITWDLSQEGCHKNYQLLNTITYSETCLIQISSLRAERHAKGSRTTQIPYADRHPNHSCLWGTGSCLLIRLRHCTWHDLFSASVNRSYSRSRVLCFPTCSYNVIHVWTDSRNMTHD